MTRCTLSSSNSLMNTRYSCGSNPQSSQAQSQTRAMSLSSAQNSTSSSIFTLTFVEFSIIFNWVVVPVISIISFIVVFIF